MQLSDVDARESRGVGVGVRRCVGHYESKLEAKLYKASDGGRSCRFGHKRNA